MSAIPCALIFKEAAESSMAFTTAADCELGASHTSALDMERLASVTGYANAGSIKTG